MSFTVKTKRFIVLGVILLAMVGALVGQYEILGVVTGGLLALLKDDSE
jgi:hypothetical protein